jgi:hypothetical protein
VGLGHAAVGGGLAFAAVGDLVHHQRDALGELYEASAKLLSVSGEPFDRSLIA